MEDSPLVTTEDTGFSESSETDTRSELKFDLAQETEEEKHKHQQIEAALNDKYTTLAEWKRLAESKCGLVNDEFRKKIWPLLLEVDPDCEDNTPSLSDLAGHSEYDQVVLDVNRSLKRFPPGIPLEQRLALQDKLTVLILRVIMKYPNLKYYQGYHDVAITFLLVVGDAASFRIMEKLSTGHLHECMEPTMEKTSYRLEYIYPIIEKVDKKLYDLMNSAQVGTMFALPWYLTWFGHSLNQYKDVVRLYDFFLSTPPLMPIYVAASLVIYRRDEVFEQDCDMAMIHCLLSTIPDNLDFEEVLKRALDLYTRLPPEKIEPAVKQRKEKEKKRREQEEKRIREMRLNKKWRRWNKYLPTWLLLHYRNRYGILFATATILFGLYAYLRATEYNFSLLRGAWNS